MREPRAAIPERTSSSRLFWTGFAGGAGFELFTSDGTAPGTGMLKDIRPGTDGSQPSAMAAFGNRVLFNAYTDAEGHDVWTSDGTAPGTVLHATTVVGAVSGGGEDFVDMGGYACFIGRSHSGFSGEFLWRTDGEPEGAAIVKDLDPAASTQGMRGPLVRAGNLFYFVGMTDAASNAPWVSDGTDGGTVLLRDIEPGTVGSQPAGFTVFGSKVFFIAQNEDTGRELWMSDGTEEGTTLVKDINPTSEAGV